MCMALNDLSVGYPDEILRDLACLDANHARSPALSRSSRGLRPALRKGCMRSD